MGTIAQLFWLLETFPLLSECFIDKPVDNDYAEFIAKYLELYENCQSTRTFFLLGSIISFDNYKILGFRGTKRNYNASSVENSLKNSQLKFITDISKLTKTFKRFNAETNIVRDNEYNVHLENIFELNNCKLKHMTNGFQLLEATDECFD